MPTSAPPARSTSSGATRSASPSPATDKIICVLPLFHIFALTTCCCAACRRATSCCCALRFDVATTLDDIEVKKATVFAGVPTMWIALANTPDLDKRDLSSLRYVGSGGAALPVEVAERFQKLTGHRLGGGWGMTETSPAGTAMPREWTGKAGSVGLPLPGITDGHRRPRRPAARAARRARRARSASRARTSPRATGTRRQRRRPRSSTAIS